MLKETQIPGYDSSKFTTELVEYISKDETPLQMQLIYNKGMKKESKNLCVLFPYHSFLPTFSLYKSYIFDNFDGVVGIPKIRGTNGFGQTWFDDGIREKTQNALDDFLAAAQFLIENKYTEPAKLVVNSEGAEAGLLAAACANQQPESFAAMILSDPYLDLLRYDQYRYGEDMLYTLGSPNDAKFFEILKVISPLHNLPDPGKKIQYPALFLQTDDNPDNDVAAAHSIKFAAAVQDAYGKTEFQKNPLLLSVQHNRVDTTAQNIEDNTQDFVFVSKVLTVPFHE